MSTVVIVESPAKCKTIRKYLGKGYQVLASYGHIRDLRAKKGSVDPDKQFAMTYSAIDKNEKHVEKIADALAKADTLLLATDPDREGEAISWHICELLKERGLLKDKEVHRVVFHEITKQAIQQAVDNPRTLSMDLVNAQQARRALDYLVGFNLSPLLWKKIRPSLSAGRVQSPALRMIVERELEIEAFKSREYWSINADLNVQKKNFQAKLSLYKNEKVEQFTFESAKQVDKAVDELQTNHDGNLTVVEVQKKQRKRNPAAPFITATLQQEAARKLGFTAQKTMRVAQQLYEGIDVGQGAVGLITYMRTDSVNLAAEAITDIRDLIEKQYGKESLPDSPKAYKTKAKNAQEAHEAIRPTAVKQTPTILKDALTKDQLRLYELIWKRTVASQMMHATIHTLVITFACGDGNQLRATGSTIAVPGFIALYQEGLDDSKDEEEEHKLPQLEKGDKVKVKTIAGSQHFTEPPPRYSEASLIKSLEEHGIGRPSTYAAIISTLQQREYVTLDQKRFYPSDVGRVVSKFLTEHFTQYVDYSFTAKLEDDLDAVSRGENEWIPLLDKFWQPFISQITTIDETVDRSDVTSEALDEKCPKCEKPVLIRLGRRGRFVGCSGYPECDYTRNLGDDQGESNEPENIDRNCPECESPLQIRVGRYGKFIGCSGYPKCKHMEPLEKPKDTGIDCPECKQGKMLERKSRHGKVFFSCETYPKCQYATWYPPVAQACPKCEWPLVVLKTTKRRGTEHACPQKECDYSEQLEAPEAS